MNRGPAKASYLSNSSSELPFATLNCSSVFPEDSDMFRDMTVVEDYHGITVKR
jgi:hypothetical protein